MSYSFRNKVILIISPETWGSFRVSKHHYASSLATGGNRVFFLTPGASRADHQQIPENVNVLNSPPLIRGLKYLPTALRKLRMARQVKFLLDQIGQSPDVVWSFDNSNFYHLDLFGADITIAHVMDHRMNHSLRSFCTGTSLCLGVTKPIVSALSQFNTNSYLLGHGTPEWSPAEVQLNHPPDRLKAMYAGNLLIPFLDRNALGKVITESTAFEFFFLSGTKENNLSPSISSADQLFLDELSEHANVHIISGTSPEEYQGYLSEADVCFLTYDNVRFPNETANSHKILEYLQAGKPVFTMPISEYTGSNVLHVVRDSNELLELFYQFASHPEKFNSEDQVIERRNYARIRSYANRIKEIESMLSHHGL